MKLSDLGRALARFLGNRKREDTMPNIQDYVLWRGDLPLERVPLCDVDALLLSYLSYMPYDHIAGMRLTRGFPCATRRRSCWRSTNGIKRRWRTTSGRIESCSPR